MQPFQPDYLILHDYGGSPGPQPSFNPYHAVVSGGRISYRNPSNPYGQAAPHAFRLNPRSIGLSWGGPVGGKPSKEDFALLKREVDKIKQQFPNIKILSHGEAYQQTRGTGQQASKLGRGLDEASWRKYLFSDQPYEPGTVEPLPINMRSMTAVAGMQRTEPPTRGAPEPMPSYKNVGGQTFMGPDAAQQSRRLANLLIEQGTQQEPMRHWTQALGKVLMTGSGALRNDMAMKDMREGQAAGNQALSQLLMGGVPEQAAAVNNPYSSERALKYVMDQKTPGNDPAIVQTYKFRQGLPENERPEFDKVQRAQQMLDLGNSYQNARTGEVVQKNLFEAERQKGLGDAQAKGEASWPKTELAYEQAKLQDGFVVQDIDTALAQAGPWTTGFAGSIGKYVAGSPQSDLAFSLQSIEANLAFDKLQAIRDASPTGGALGAVTERELDLLKSAWGSIAQAQSEEQFKSRLQRLKQIKAQYAILKQRAYEQDKQRFGAASVPNPQSGQMNGSALQGRGNQPLLAPQGGVKEYDFDPATGNLVAR